MIKRNKGQAIVEMALVLPIFIFMLIGIFDFGRALHAWSNLNYQCIQAARAGTRLKRKLVGAGNIIAPSLYPTMDDVQKAFWKYRSPLMPQDKYANLSFSGVGTTNKTVEIKASFNLTLYTPVIGSLIGGNNKSGGLTIHASAMETKEQS
jgi:hypothetical protein